jgi:hypothetical protein
MIVYLLLLNYFFSFATETGTFKQHVQHQVMVCMRDSTGWVTNSKTEIKVMWPNSTFQTVFNAKRLLYMLKIHKCWPPTTNPTILHATLYLLNYVLLFSLTIKIEGILVCINYYNINIWDYYEIDKTITYISDIEIRTKFLEKNV